MTPTIEYYKSECVRIDAEKAEYKRLAKENAQTANDRAVVVANLKEELRQAKLLLAKAEKALQPFDMAHIDVLEGLDPSLSITLADLRTASEVYHEIPRQEVE